MEIWEYQNIQQKIADDQAAPIKNQIANSTHDIKWAMNGAGGSGPTLSREAKIAILISAMIIGCLVIPIITVGGSALLTLLNLPEEATNVIAFLERVGVVVLGAILSVVVYIKCIKKQK